MKYLVIVLSLFGAYGCSAPINYGVYSNEFQDAFNNIELNSTEQEVIEYMGNPDQVEHLKGNNIYVYNRGEWSFLIKLHDSKVIGRLESDLPYSILKKGNHPWLDQNEKQPQPAVSPYAPQAARE
ncbi:MAG: hypothetical protein PHQ41_11550 [Candidatus Cloacimonetes bacterium]|nr:hypothetical protein [Candidatus Cloacimonadota bacterium]